MCKVMMMAGIKKENTNKAIAFVKTMAPIMSTSNTDGLGYAAIHKSGAMFGERWLINNQAFTDLSKLKETPQITRKYFKHLVKDNNFYTPPAAGEYNSFGTVDMDNMVAITLHTRMATSPKAFKNTHPFIHEDTSVIHNGVINNDYIYRNEMKSSCDSEALLHSYLKHEIGKDPSNIEKLAKELIGYYACGVFSKDAEGNRIMDIFKANNNNLAVAYVNELETYVFSSSGRDIKEACDKLGFTFIDMVDVEDGYLIRLNPYTGELLGDVKFEASRRWASDYNNYSDTYPRYNGATTYNPSSNTPTTTSESERNISSILNRVRDNQTKKGGMTKEEIEYLQQPPSIEKVSERDMWDYFQASGYWGD